MCTGAREISRITMWRKGRKVNSTAEKVCELESWNISAGKNYIGGKTEVHDGEGAYPSTTS